MTAAKPTTDVRTHLNTQVGALTAGTNLFDGSSHAVGTGVPAKAVFVLASGGPGAEAYIGSPEERRWPNVQCVVRSDAEDFAGGEALARLVRDTLHHQTITRTGGGSYDGRVMQDEPIYMGPNEARQHEWSVNTELYHEEA